ncbi:MAG: MotA/TolQ/ExbB proton channel family protein [Methylobacter sp.]
MQAESLDTLKFISEGGPVSMAVAAALLLMSVGSWTLMIVKAVQARRIKNSSAIFLGRFWQTAASTKNSTAEPVPVSSIAAAMRGMIDKAETPFARLTLQGFNAAIHHIRYTGQRPSNATQDHSRYDEFITQALRRTIGQEHMRLENGLTLLASVGSIAPFIGLFGTVWGIYHALGTIAASGLATIDKVAGPVGEALIMTAFGLAVAIPAVLAYNALVRENRVLMGEVETFAHDLHTYLTTGVPLATEQTVAVSGRAGETYGAFASSTGVAS